MTLVRCLYTGYPGELEDRTLLVPGESIIEVPADVAAEHPHYWPVDKDDKVIAAKAKAKTKALSEPDDEPDEPAAEPDAPEPDTEGGDG